MKYLFIMNNLYRKELNEIRSVIVLFVLNMKHPLLKIGKII